MKLLPLLAALVWIAGSAFGQGAQADMIKRRAQGLAEQNNAQQGVAPHGQPAPSAPKSATPAAPATPATPQQIATGRIRAALAPLLKTEGATPERKQALVKDLLAAARGAEKPFAGSVGKLTDRLAAALPQAGSLTANDQLRLAQDLDGLVNCGGLPRKQTDAIADDLMTVLQAGGAGHSAAAAVANEARGVALEVQKPAKN